MFVVRRGVLIIFYERLSNGTECIVKLLPATDVAWHVLWAFIKLIYVSH